MSAACFHILIAIACLIEPMAIVDIVLEEEILVADGNIIIRRIGKLTGKLIIQLLIDVCIISLRIAAGDGS